MHPDPENSNREERPAGISPGQRSRGRGGEGSGVGVAGRRRLGYALQGASLELASEGYLRTPHRWRRSRPPLWPGTLCEDYS